MSQGRDSLRATDTIYMFPLMERYSLCVVLVSLMPPSPAVLLADLQWTSSDEHTCSRMKTTSPYGYAGSLRGTCTTSAQTSNWHSETQISSLEFSPSCHHVARLMIKAWCFKGHVDTWVYSKDDTMAHTRRLVVIS